jgi:hypothetical protein
VDMGELTTVEVPYSPHNLPTSNPAACCTCTCTCTCTCCIACHTCSKWDFLKKSIVDKGELTTVEVPYTNH